MANKVPKIRFKGFTDDWEQRKLGDLLKEFSIKSTIENEYKVLSSTNSGMEFREGRVSGTSNLGYKIIKNGDLVLSPQNLWLGNININNLGKGLVSPSYKTFELINIDSSFINPQLRTQKMLEEYKNSSTQGASVVRRNLEIDSFYQIKIFVPTISEQEKIGSFFKQLDNTIALHQRKCDQTKELKKFMLQKMFPKKGEKNPEIRFSGFTDDWEQRKLGEIVERVTRKNQSLQSQLPLTISAQFGLIDQNEFFDKRIASKDVSGYYLIKNGEFAYNKSTSVDAPWGAIKRLDRYEMGVLSTLYIVFRIRDSIKTNSDYIVTYYDTNIWHKEVKAIAAEGARNHGLLNITPSDFFETVITLPKDFEEQQKIGEYFSNLDNLITLHQRKCEQLKELKKFMLQNMFPKKG